MKYCSKCGKELLDEAVICINCGCKTTEIKTFTNDEIVQKDNTIATKYHLVNIVSKRILVSSIIWIVLGTIQVALGTGLLVTGGIYSLEVQYGLLFFFSIAVPGILNLVISIAALNYSKHITEYSIGVVDKVLSAKIPNIMIFYTLLCRGSNVFSWIIFIISTVLLIYYFVAIRNYVLKNKQAFLEIENQQLG